MKIIQSAYGVRCILISSLDSFFHAAKRSVLITYLLVEEAEQDVEDHVSALAAWSTVFESLVFTTNPTSCPQPVSDFHRAWRTGFSTYECGTLTESRKIWFSHG